MEFQEWSEKKRGNAGDEKNIPVARDASKEIIFRLAETEHLASQELLA